MQQQGHAERTETKTNAARTFVQSSVKDVHFPLTVSDYCFNAFPQNMDLMRTRRSGSWGSSATTSCEIQV